MAKGDGTASFGHIAIGLVAGRAFTRVADRRRLVLSMAGFSALSMLPDADVIAFALRIPYGDPFGHRGATHSIAFAVLCGVIAFALRRDSRLAAFTSLVVVTHPLLDMLTDGGLGCALFFPFSSARLFWPVQPIPVAPIGAGMLSARGLFVVVTELVLFSPLVIWAFRRPRPEKPPN
ncbi:MAG: metal-dependent hydrolase [Myxococcales bacterium]|nr:metal-dependent hydrolase [Myxococcales bacterium]